MKRIIVCCDGTWNEPEKLDPKESIATNVLNMSRAILPKASNGTIQVIEYVRGIGTGNYFDHLLGGISGKGISSNILQAYQFISNNFQPGDEIYLFGFSRGAYTARSLSGFIYHFGILMKQYQSVLPNMYRDYQKAITPDQIRDAVTRYEGKIDRDLEKCYLTDRERRCIPIQFLGVWDTVGELGVPFGPFQRVNRERIHFHDTELAPNVDYAYHALAIHEYRKNFSPTLWTQCSARQKVEQVWFPGAHSDVGGGINERGLSNAALLWMAGRAKRAGLEMNDSYLKSFTPNPHAAVNDSRKGIYRTISPYARLIGGCTLPECKHESVVERFNHMPARVKGGRLSHEKTVDTISLSLPYAVHPKYL